eukprot:g3841.t1
MRHRRPTSFAEPPPGAQPEDPRQVENDAEMLTGDDQKKIDEEYKETEDDLDDEAKEKIEEKKREMTDEQKEEVEQQKALLTPEGREKYLAEMNPEPKQPEPPGPPPEPDVQLTDAEVNAILLERGLDVTKPASAQNLAAPPQTLEVPQEPPPVVPRPKPVDMNTVVAEEERRQMAALGIPVVPEAILQKPPPATVVEYRKLVESLPPGAKVEAVIAKMREYYRGPFERPNASRQGHHRFMENVRHSQGKPEAFGKPSVAPRLPFSVPGGSLGATAGNQGGVGPMSEERRAAMLQAREDRLEREENDLALQNEIANRMEEMQQGRQEQQDELEGSLLGAPQ